MNNVVPYPSAEQQPPVGMVPAEEHLRVCQQEEHLRVCQQLERVSRERDHWQQVAQERGQIIGRQADELRQMREERTAFFAAVNNTDLTAGEKLDGLLTIFEAHYEGTKPSEMQGFRFSRKKPPEGAHEISVRSIARQAGRSDDAVTKDIARLQGFGLWEKETIRGWNEEQERPQDVTFLYLPSKSLVENVYALAHLRVTPEMRAAVTEELEKKPRTKPGPPKGEKREKIIKATCPSCGSSDTRLDCRACGARHDTADLPDEGDTETAAVSYGDGSEDRGEGEGALGPEPQLTADITGSITPATYGDGEPVHSTSERNHAEGGTESTQEGGWDLTGFQTRETGDAPEGKEAADGNGPPVRVDPAEARGSPAPEIADEDRCRCGRLYRILGTGARQCRVCGEP